MSLWTRISEALTALIQGQPLSAVFDLLRGQTSPERSVGFTIAVIALGAKLAKVDGTVERSEVAAFRRVVIIPRSEEKNAARVFDLARQDVAGFDAWARRIARMFPPGDPVLDNVIEGMVIIGTADGALHPVEHEMLEDVAQIFGIAPERLATIIARHDAEAETPPHIVLGLPPDATVEEARARWRSLVRENHPDRAIAAGLPREAIRLAETRTRALNDAWAQYRRLRVPQQS